MTDTPDPAAAPAAPAAPAASPSPGAASFERFARSEAGPLYTLLVRVTGDVEAARDLLQDTLLDAWRNLAAYDPSRPLRNWIFRLGQNRLRNFLRRKRLEGRWMRALDEEPASEAGSRDAEARERGEVLERALLRLRAEQRVVLLLRYQEDLSCAEIADLLDTTPNAVSIQLHHARKRLREILEKHEKSLGGASHEV
ncbi:MAG: sigma-70 family RNA polymerase sigma factor [Planctomycetes bacterium]|nr:sigma-70 family RNA polymerase sigma factor [Planctomycetota bacterium]